MTDNHDDNTASADESFDHCFVAGKTGVGKTTKLVGVMSEIADESGYNIDTLAEVGSGRTSAKSRRAIKRLLAHSDDETGPVWFDPKGNPDTQNHDDSSNDTDRLADVFEQNRSDETTGHNPAVFGQVGTGKTHQIGTEFARRLTDNTETTEFVDPKGEREGEENGR